jgi:hypothetical protein
MVLMGRTCAAGVAGWLQPRFPWRPPCPIRTCIMQDAANVTHLATRLWERDLIGGEVAV